MMKEVNLLPHDIVDAEENRNRFRFWITVVIVILLIFLPLFISLEGNIYELRAKVFRNIKEKEKVQEMGKKLNLLEEEKRRLISRQEVLSEIIDDIPWHQTLLKISNSLNHNTWLEQLDISKTDEKSENKKISREVIKATGGYFVSLNSADSQSKDDSFKIGIQGYAVSNIDLAEFMASLSTERKFKSVNLEFAERTKLEGFEAVKFLIRCEI